MLLKIALKRIARVVHVLTEQPLHIRGKQNLESASKKLIINKSIHMLDISKPDPFKSFVKPAREMKSIKLEWNEKLKQHENNGFSKKEMLNLREESKKYELLEFLKNQPDPGLFTTVESIDKFMDFYPQSEEKNKRMYKEVLYAKKTSSIPNTAVFRLKRDKNLSTSEYAINLKSYIHSTRSSKSITISDLRNVLYGLVTNSQNNVTTTI